MIQLRNIFFSHTTKPFLQNFNLNIEEGSTTLLLGPSGCGKSTLLRLINLLLKPQQGDVVIRGETVSDLNIFKIRKQTGYVIQEGGLFPHMTARQNITLMAERQKWNTARIHERVQELSDLTQFPPERLDQYPVNLSGGQRQRVSLMRALMLDPDILLLDEPFGALDPLIRAGLQEQMKKIFATLNKTVLMVSHDVHEAAYLADQIVLMGDGAIVQRGSIEQLVLNPATPFVKEFFYAQRSHLPPAVL